MQFIKATDKYCTLEEHIAAPMFRKTFDLSGNILSAKLSITVTGFYELYLNGKNITKGLLAPYINNPDHLMYLDSYDASAYLRKGKNAVTVILGNGFGNQDISSWEFAKAPFRSSPKLALTLAVTTDNGEVYITSDETFKVAESPLLFDMYRLGVIYDARKEVAGFSTPGFDDTAWAFATIADAPKGKIIPSHAVPIKIREELKPCRIERQSDFYCLYYKNGLPMKEYYVSDGWLYDFGVNTAGVCRLKIKGERGQKITVRHGERLRDGLFDIGSTITIKADTPKLSEYFQRDVYYLKGGEEEIFFPSFTYHGFRYAFVEGITPEQATEDLLTYAVFNTELPRRSHFECSDSTVNQLYEMTLRSDLSNFHHFPTDCPHREKNGWTGDASVSAHQLLLGFHCGEPLSVWLDSAKCAQTEEGKLPGIIPTVTWGYDWGSGPAWDAAIINIPYYIYRYDGRTDVISDNADMIEKYLRYIASRKDERGLVACGLGDWCQPREDGEAIASPLEFTDSVQVLDLAGKSAFLLDVIGRSEASTFARQLESEMCSAIREHLIDSENRIAVGACQTSQALALRFGLFTDEEREEAYAKLIGMIEEKAGHVYCGMIGLRYIFHVLFENGDSELALKMITREDAPSYGNMIKLGGTALFESLIPNGINESENHHFYGDILHLFISKLAGIRVNPTLSNINSAVITPTVPESISWAYASYDFVCGTLVVKWEKISDIRIRLTTVVPEGSDIKVCYGGYTLQLASGENITELPV